MHDGSKAMPGRITAVGFVITLVTVAGCAHPPAQPPRDPSPIEIVLTTTEYTRLGRMGEIPTAIRQVLGCPPDGACPDMAESDEYFNHTDVIEPGIPTRRLVIAGIADSSAFVLYDQGGFVPLRRLLVVRLEEQRVTANGHFHVVRPVATMDDLRKLVPSGLIPIPSEEAMAEAWLPTPRIDPVR